LSALNVPNNASPHIAIRCKTDELKNKLSSETALIKSLVKAGQADILGPSDEDPSGSIKSHVSEEIQTLVKIVGLIDIKLEVSLSKPHNYLPFIDR
jgi:valyl-tRNA synthetase